MPSVTYHVALAFIRTVDGELVPGEAQQLETPMGALSAAQAMAATSAGAVAYSRTGDPGTGEFEDAVVIKTFGEVPAWVAR